jgi:hypothetical protein
MQPGELRTFDGFTITANGRFFFPGTTILLVERISDTVNPRWKVLVDGVQEVVDDYTIVSRSHETR